MHDMHFTEWSNLTIHSNLLVIGQETLKRTGIAKNAAMLLCKQKDDVVRMLSIILPCFAGGYIF